MTYLLDQETDLGIRSTDLGISNNADDFPSMSSWTVPLPREEYSHSSVVVYFYSEIWIPITCFSLAEALELYRKALVLGKQILLYPPCADPYTEITIGGWEKQLETKS